MSFEKNLNQIFERLLKCTAYDDFEKLGKDISYSNFSKTAYGVSKKPLVPDNILSNLQKPADFFLLSYILGVQAKTESANEAFIRKSEEFLFMKPQLPVASCLDGYADVFRAWIAYKRKHNEDDLEKLIEPLRTLIFNMQSGNPKMLTPIHCELLHIMWEHRLWDFWEHSVDICELPMGGLKIVEFLRYFYYAGCIHLLHKRYVQAIQSFSIVLTIPKDGNLISVIQIDAMKRYKLASLIHYGKTVEAPCSKTRYGWTTIENRIPEYVEIEQAFKESLKGSIDNLDTAMAKHMDTLANDMNYGLCKRVRHAVFRQRVLILTKVYLAVPVNKLAELVFKENKQSDDYTLDMLLDMKQKKEISFELEESKELSLEEQPPCQIIRFNQYVDLSSKAEEVMRKVKQLSESMVRTAQINELTAGEGATPSIAF